MRGPLAVGLLLAVLASGCGGGDPPPPAPPPSVPAPPPPVAEPEPVVLPDPYRIRTVRTATELLVFAVRGGRAQPAARVPVKVLPEDGVDPVEAVTSSKGVVIMKLPATVNGDLVVGPEGRASTIPLPPPPASTRAEAAMAGLLLTDRSEARPGDTLRVALWLTRFGDRDERGTLVLPGAEKREVEFLPGGGRAPGWTVATVHIPFDARPGRAWIRWKDATAVVPLRGRVSGEQGFDEGDAPAHPASANPEREEGLRIAAEDGQWRVTAEKPLDGRPLLLVAYSDHEIITQQTAMEEGDSALLRLALGDRSPEGITLLAVTADRDGFPEGRVALRDLWKGTDLVLKAEPAEEGRKLKLTASASGGRGLERVVVALDDPERPAVRPRLHRLDGPAPTMVMGDLDPGARYRIRAVGQLQGGGRVLRASLPALDPVAGDPPASRPAFQRPADILPSASGVRTVPLTRWTVRVDLRAGETMSESHRASLLNARRQGLTWVALAPEDAGGPVRLTADGVIILETRLEAGNDVGRRGVLSRAVVKSGPLELMAAVDGLAALRLEALTLESGSDDAAVDEGYSVERAVRRSDTNLDLQVVTVSISRRGDPRRTFVELPLPGGVELAIDGWELREAARAALPEDLRDEVRLLLSATTLHWDLPAIPAAGLTLEVPLRDAHPGTWTWPPVHVTGEGDDAPRGRSSGGRVVIKPR